jgi:hypothetical protein
MTQHLYAVHPKNLRLFLRVCRTKYDSQYSNIIGIPLNLKGDPDLFSSLPRPLPQLNDDANHDLIDYIGILPYYKDLLPG